MKGRLGDKLRLQHILDSICEIENYLYDVTIEQFLGIQRNVLQL
ncbi:hypothetical protein SAMN05443550_10533 [Pedobacter hartonius]|uniref:Uncharacterized protein n=1 Tax=Pedobacter hartonius TaxID=425514 RepID=A0A1H4DPA8_9SPHI|nr:hypothetical protein SAMN05443550_10533 [Pedobacter hartonius]